MPGFHRHHAHFAHRGHPFSGAIWLVGIGIMMLTGFWWPGILVLIGLSLILEAVFKESTPQIFDDVRPSSVVVDAPPPAASAPVRPVVTMPVAPPAPAYTTHRLDLLPANCPHCGGPIRSYEVKWTGPQAASCPYCGSVLPMKKS